MEKSKPAHDISKGLDLGTVQVLRDRLKASYAEEHPHFTCYFHTELKVGWIICKGKILIYNHENVYFELKLPPKLDGVKADQIIIVNNENGAFLIIADGQFVYSRKIDEEFDRRYLKKQIEQLEAEEDIKVVHLLNSNISTVPSLLISTTKGRLINAQILVSEDDLLIDELVIRPPKRYLNSLTSFFVGNNELETNYHSLHSVTTMRN
jgi:hypothetical protein